MYDIGDRITLTGLFANIAKVPTNPTAVTLAIRKPDGDVIVVAQGSMTNPSVGTWAYDFSPDQAGSWWFRWSGTGAVTAAEEKRFLVRSRKVPNPAP